MKMWNPFNIISDWESFDSRFSEVLWQGKGLGLSLSVWCRKFQMFIVISVDLVVERVNMGQTLAVCPIQQPL